jgi:hypothetical protein
MGNRSYYSFLIKFLLPNLRATMLSTCFVIIILLLPPNLALAIDNQQYNNSDTDRSNGNSNAPLISDTLRGTIIGGIIGFVSSIGVDYVKNWINRPRLSIREGIENITFYYPTEYSLRGGISSQPTQFASIRIKVKNKGNKAAENCKAILFKDPEEVRIGWMIPREDLTVIINAHDTEYIDLCAIAEYQNNWIRIPSTLRL